MCRLCGHSILSAFGFPEWSDLLDALGFTVVFCKQWVSPVTASSWKLQVLDSEKSTSPDSSFVATGFSVAVSINPSRYASCSRTWELYAASDFEFLLILLSGFPVAMSITGLLDAIGLFTDEELAGTCEDKFIAVDFDFATIISSPLCSCKTYVFSDSVLCGRKIGDDPIANWKSKIKWFLENNHFKDTNRFDGMPTEFEWKNIPRNHNVG